MKWWARGGLPPPRGADRVSGSNLMAALKTKDGPVGCLMTGPDDDEQGWPLTCEQSCGHAASGKLFLRRS